MVARRPADKRSRAPVTVTAFIVGALALCGPLTGCRPPAENDPVGRAAQALSAPCGLPADTPVGDDELGVALAFTAADAPRDLEGTAALVRASGGGVEIQLLEGAAGDPVALAAASLTRPACRMAAADRIQVQATGGRLRWRSPADVARESWLQAGHHE